LLGKVSTAAPYWGACGVELVAIAVASFSATRLVAKNPAGDGVADVRAMEQARIERDP
jgi:hypothetical protein